MAELTERRPAARVLEDGMRVTIKTWEAMVAEYGMKDNGIINCHKGFVPAMKHLCGLVVDMRAEMIREDRVSFKLYDERNDRSWYITQDMYNIEFAPVYVELIPGTCIRIKTLDELRLRYGKEDGSIRLPGNEQLLPEMHKFCGKKYWVNEQNIHKLSKTVFMLMEESGDVWDFTKYMYEIVAMPGEAVPAEPVAAVPPTIELEPSQKTWVLNVLDNVVLAALNGDASSKAVSRVDAITKIKQVIAQ